MPRTPPTPCATPGCGAFTKRPELIDRVSEWGFLFHFRRSQRRPRIAGRFLRQRHSPVWRFAPAACLRSDSAVALDWSLPSDDDARFRVEARFYEKLPGKNVRCKMCPRGCVVGDRQRGHCRVRENGEGRTIRWSTRGCARLISTRSRRSPSSISIPAFWRSRWPRPDAT